MSIDIVYSLLLWHIYYMVGGIIHHNVVMGPVVICQSDGVSCHTTHIGAVSLATVALIIFVKYGNRRW